MEAIGKFSKQKGDLQLSGKGAKSILKYLLPILTLGEKISDYNTGPKANARLNKIAQDGDGKTLWEIELKNHAGINDDSAEGAA